MKNVEGKVVVITGASSGLGEATARHLSAEGATVVLGARRLDRIQAIARELSARGGKAAALRTDVTDHAQVKQLVDLAVETYGRVDVILNNAGLMPHSPSSGSRSRARGRSTRRRRAVLERWGTPSRRRSSRWPSRPSMP